MDNEELNKDINDSEISHKHDPAPAEPSDPGASGAPKDSDPQREHSDTESSPYYGTNVAKKDSDAKTKNSGAASLFDIAEMFAICAAIVLIVFFFVARLTVVDGPSMEPTLYKNDFILVRSIGYTPKRGDIIVVDDPTAGYYAHPLIKRVIAVGGDTLDIDFDTWTVTVNGEVIDESPYFDNSTIATLRADSLPKVIEEGHVFVMGDNRNHSADSRTSAIGQIDERCVVGKAEIRVFPFNKFTVFHNPFEDRSE